MKKAMFILCAMSVGMIQFGCGFMGVHNVLVHLLGAGWTLDLFNIVP